MLPFSTDHPHTPPVQYSQHNPPYVPQVEMLPEGQPMLVLASSIVANEAAFSAGQSPARMYVYNMLSSNAWANTAFAEVVKLACDYSIVKQRMGQAHTPSSILIETAREALSLYVSKVIMETPPLQQLMSQDHIAAAANNHRIYYDVIAAISAMYAQSAPYQPPQARFGARVPGTMAPTGSMRTMGNPVAQAAASNPAAQGMIMGRNQIPNPPTQPSNLGSRYPIPGTKSIKIDTSSSIQKIEEKPKVTEVVQPVTPISPSTINQGIETMDRDQHAIAYFGKTYEAPVEKLRVNMEEAIAKTETTIEKMPAFSEAFKREEMWVSGACLDELIYNVLAKQVMPDNYNVEIYQCSGVVMHPIFSSLPMDVLERLKGSETFANMSRILTEYLDEVEEINEKRKALIFVSQIDRVLTKMLSVFLKTTLANSKVQITSFIEDAISLGKYLSDKFNGKYNVPYNTFQRVCTAILFKYPDELKKTTEAINEQWSDITNVGSVATLYTVTMLSMSSAELNYGVEEKQKRVSAHQTPMLYRLLETISAYENKAAAAMHHVLLTSDGVRYCVAKVCDEEGVFVISEI